MYSSVGLYQYAIYFELVAYPRIVCDHVRLSKFKDIDIEEKRVIGIPVLKLTMDRLVKHLVRYGINKPSQRLFDFSRQMTHKVWKASLERAGVSQRATMKDYKEAFNTYLRMNQPDYKG